MKIACFYSDSMFASWSLSDGLVETLNRMGHEVTTAPVPAIGRQVKRSEVERQRAIFPTIEKLNEQDAILVCGLEHCKNWIGLIYSHQGWQSVKTRKLAWYHESFHRADYSIQFADMVPWADEHFLPNPDDAEKHKGEWLPIGVDTEMFKPFQHPYCNPTITAESQNVWAPASWEMFNVAMGEKQPKKYDVAFIGLLYQKRMDFLKTLAPHINEQKVDVICGNVQIQDLSGVCMRQQTELLAQNYRQCKILLNLPSLSNVLVMKILEASACGTAVFSNQVEATAKCFTDGKDIAFYDESKPEELTKKLKEYLNDDSMREEVAREGCNAVHEKHRLDQRLEQMLTKVAVPVG